MAISYVVLKFDYIF